MHITENASLGSFRVWHVKNSEHVYLNSVGVSPPPSSSRPAPAKDKRGLVVWTSCLDFWKLPEIVALLSQGPQSLWNLHEDACMIFGGLGPQVSAKNGMTCHLWHLCYKFAITGLDISGDNNNDVLEEPLTEHLNVANHDIPVLDFVLGLDI